MKKLEDESKTNTKRVIVSGLLDYSTMKDPKHIMLSHWGMF